jgi:DNA-binding HxlR family transcriptional regulator
VLEYELTGPGRELLFVAGALESWLGRAAERPLPIDSGAAKAATKALTEGWSSTMVRALAAGPLSLTELDGVIGSFSYPSLERRLAAMRLAGLVEAQPANGRGRPYGVTEWLRRGVAPLAGAARWERRHLPRQTAPVGRLDIEAAFLLTLPLLQLPAKLSGTCRMAAEIPDGDGRRLAGATVEVERGRIASCATQLQAGAGAWALGSPAAWLNAVIESDVDCLELGGDRRLAMALLSGLHGVLFGLPASRANGALT